MSAKKQDTRGQSEASRKNLEKGGKNFPTVHGAYTRHVSLYGIPLKRICPFKDECDCDTPDDKPCPALTLRAATKQAELEKLGCSADAAAQIVRLDGQALMIYHYLSKAGYVRVNKDKATGQPVIGPQPILHHLGVVENSLSRLLRDTGQLRALAGEHVLTPEQLAAMHRRAREAEVEE